jgi:hypothetical protein
VVSVGLLNRKKNLLAIDKCSVRILGVDSKTANDSSSIPPEGVVNEEHSVFPEPRVEGESQQPFLIAPSTDLFRDIEKGGSGKNRGPVFEDPDLAVLFEHEEALGVVGRVGDVGRTVEFQVGKCDPEFEFGVLASSFDGVGAPQEKEAGQEEGEAAQKKSWFVHDPYSTGLLSRCKSLGISGFVRGFEDLGGLGVDNDM